LLNAKENNAEYEIDFEVLPALHVNYDKLHDQQCGAKEDHIV